MIDRAMLKINLELRTIDILKKHKLITQEQYNERWLKVFKELGELVSRPTKANV